MLRSSRQRNSRAVTIVELMVGMVITGILMVGIGSLIVAAVEATVKSRQRLEIERRADFAMSYVQRRARAKTSGEIGVNEAGDELTLDPGEPDAEVYSVSNGDFIRTQGLDTEILVDDVVAGVAFSLEEGHTGGQYLLRMTLQVSDAEQSLQLEELTKLRN